MTGRRGADATDAAERILLHDGHRLVGGCDEVGRGALAGPVTVGITVIDLEATPPPRGLRDSKLLSPRARVDLVEPIRNWARGWAVASASPAEIDAHGLTVALRTAAHRALAELARAGWAPTAVILDGRHDWLSPPRQPTLGAPEIEGVVIPEVTTEIGADRRCATVAAASVLAKVDRDGVMERLDVDHPDFGWSQNKGYGAPAHLDALARQGPSPQHRRSWRLPSRTSPEQG